MSDFSNRRKELKFAATDLKLYRRQQATRIEHWGVWRRNALPLTFFLWAARLREPAEPGVTDRSRWVEDRIEALVREATALVDTYLDGAGIYAWKLPRRNLDSGLAGGRLSRSGTVRISSYFRTL